MIIPVTRRTAALLAALTLGLALGALPAPAQDAPTPPALAPSDTILEIHLVDGSVLYGRVVETRAGRVVEETSGGVRVEVDRAQIRLARPAAADRGAGERDANMSRLFFGPTGRTLESGTGYVGLFELFFPFVAYGPTDWITLAGGTPIIPGGGTGEVFYLAPKVRVLSIPGVQVSGGVLAFFATQEVDEGSIGIAYGVATLGSVDRALTVGAGWPFALRPGEEVFTERPVFQIGGESLAGSRYKWITENYIVPGEGVLVSGGARIFGNRFSADVGLGAGLSGDLVGCCLPLLNLVYVFGGGR